MFRNLILVLAVGAMAFATSSADAGNRGRGGYYGGVNRGVSVSRTYNRGYSNNFNRGYSNRVYRPNYYGGRNFNSGSYGRGYGYGGGFNRGFYGGGYNSNFIRIGGIAIGF